MWDSIMTINTRVPISSRRGEENKNLAIQQAQYTVMFSALLMGSS